ncbi:hypothetical protein K488DRAFT_68185 [Vararia minispora EC-137]|uniref:Uncharacterized protein n=1 Tax=Vararia minispora EC-137 TaxID=1314806 RepID=A0ACB8QV83_9AGAM|nr:hypothetical protein K488DRAFT_68185 [Vararia minispora EC-137]
MQRTGCRANPCSYLHPSDSGWNDASRGASDSLSSDHARYLSSRRGKASSPRLASSSSIHQGWSGPEPAGPADWADESPSWGFKAGNASTSAWAPAATSKKPSSSTRQGSGAVSKDAGVWGSSRSGWGSGEWSPKDDGNKGSWGTNAGGGGWGFGTGEGAWGSGTQGGGWGSDAQGGGWDSGTQGGGSGSGTQGGGWGSGTQVRGWGSSTHGGGSGSGTQGEGWGSSTQGGGWGSGTQGGGWGSSTHGGGSGSGTQREGWGSGAAGDWRSMGDSSAQKTIDDTIAGGADAGKNVGVIGIFIPPSLTSSFFSTITRTIAAHRKAQEAGEREFRVRRMRKSVAYSRSSFAARERLDADRQLYRASKHEADKSFEEAASRLPRLPEIGQHIRRIDPSSSNVSMISFLKEVETWFEQLEPSVRQIIDRRKAYLENRLVTPPSWIKALNQSYLSSDFQPLNVPPGSERLVDHIKRLEDIVRQHSDVSQGSDGDLISTLKALFDDNIDIMNAIRTAHRDTVQRVLHTQLEGVAEHETQVGQAVEKRAKEVAEAIASSSPSKQLCDNKKDIEEWRLQLKAQLASNAQDLKTLVDQHEAIDTQLSTAFVTQLPQSCVHEIVAGLVPLLPNLVKNTFEPALKAVHEGTLRNIEQQQEEAFAFIWKSIAPSIVLTHYCTLKGDRAS